MLNRTLVLPAAFSRPANTTAYASGDLVADNTTAGSVTPLSWTLPEPYGASPGMIRRARLRKSGTTVTSATFRLHLFVTAPTVANGDNGALSVAGVAGYLGFIDLDMSALTNFFSDGGAVIGAPSVGSEINFVATSRVIYGLLEARAAYTPASGETFTVTLEVVPD